MRPATIISLIIKAALAVAVLSISTGMLFGQDKLNKGEYKEKYREFCSNNNSWGDRVSINDVRQFTVPATGSLAVDGNRNGGIKVRGENRGDIQVKACVQAWGTSEEAARALLSGIRISNGSTIKADAASEENWSVSYEILVPRNTDLQLTAHNGGIAISSVEGRLSFETTNGGVSLSDVAGEVRGRTTNGGINVNLSGNGWRGSGLDVQTTNGGVHVAMPDTYAANFEASTTNGGFHSDITGLAAEKKDRDWSRPTRVANSINGGGAPLKFVTTNGGVHISSTRGDYKN
jgi:hypothetical protein